MEKNKNMMALDDDALNKITGGGTAEAEAYLKELMQKYDCERYDLYPKMTKEEYEKYVKLYNS